MEGARFQIREDGTFYFDEDNPDEKNVPDRLRPETLKLSEEESVEVERQKAEVLTKYKNTESWMKAPNGQPTKLSEGLWIMVRTPFFKQWFGDWEKGDTTEVVTDRADTVSSLHPPSSTYADSLRLGDIEYTPKTKKVNGSFFLRTLRGTVYLRLGTDSGNSFRVW